MVSSKNETAVIDPRRDCDIYLETSKKWEAKIKYIFETHRNEDYVVGSVELSKSTGAQVLHGPGLNWGYGSTIRDKQEFVIGALKIMALHTPGHSPDSSSYVVMDTEANNQPILVFTGDTIFVGDVGRTDFLGPENTPAMSEKMYSSIFDKLIPLGDQVMVFPAHGTGSVCGGKISEREISTIGIEKATNPMLKLSKQQFIATKVAEHHQSPPYFKKMEEYNLNGPPINSRLTNPCPLKPSEFKEKMMKGAYIVDVRSPVSFGGGHIKNSYSLPPSRLSNAGWVLPYDKPILIVAENIESLDFANKSLYRLGYDNVEGYLAKGLESWYKEALPLAKLNTITVQELKNWIDTKQDITILDVRRESELNEGYIKNSIHIYLGKVQKEANKLPHDKPVCVICKTGNRSSFGASILLREGFIQVYNILGGTDAWKKNVFPLVK